MTKRKYNTRVYIGCVYTIAGDHLSGGVYHNFDIGSEVKIISIKGDLCDCEQNGERQYIKKSDLRRCKN